MHKLIQSWFSLDRFHCIMLNDSYKKKNVTKFNGHFGTNGSIKKCCLTHDVKGHILHSFEGLSLYKVLQIII